MDSRKSLVVLSALVLICLSSSGARSDQVAPDVSIECDDVIDSVDSSPSHPTNSVYFDCFVENPSTFTEEIRLQYSSSELEVIGETMIVLGPGGSTTLQVQARASIHMEAGQYDSSVTATVNRVNGVQTGILAPSDSDDFSVTVDPFTECDVYETPEVVEIGRDRRIGFDVLLDCSSNEGVTVRTSFVMIEFGKLGPQNPDPVYWPDGFNDESPPCEISTEIGFSTHYCTFVASSDSSSLSTLDICLAMHNEGDDAPVFCSSNPIEVQKSLFGFSSTGSIGILVPATLVASLALAGVMLWRRAGMKR